MIIAEGRSANTRGEDHDNSKVQERQTAPTNQGFLHAPHPGRVLTGRWWEGERANQTHGTPIQARGTHAFGPTKGRTRPDRARTPFTPSSRNTRLRTDGGRHWNSLRRSREPAGGRRRRVQASTLELASDVLENPGEWLRTSNTQLGNRRPIDLMGTEEEEKVFDLLHAVDQGLF